MLWYELKTEFAKLDGTADEEIYHRASQIINSGGLVAFPTETVYGLGANAFDVAACKKIYAAKGRPSDNPLIVHISDIKDLYPLISGISEKTQKLIDAFWPAPLTVVFRKSGVIPYEITGGLETVAVRFPKNIFAARFIKACGVPIAAPSANSSGKPSPTHASHVLFDLDGKIDMIIDGGHCEFGLESTIVDACGDTPYLLRPGSVTKSMIEDVIGHIEIDKAVLSPLSSGEKPKAPGMKYTHYSPEANVTIVSGSTEKVASFINEKLKSDSSACVIASEQTSSLYDTENLLIIGDRNIPKTIGSNLFKMLRKCDYLNFSSVYCESFDDSEEGLAIMNRLKKAAGYNIINL